MTVIVAGDPVRLPKGATVVRVTGTVHYLDVDGQPGTVQIDRDLAVVNAPALCVRA